MSLAPRHRGICRDLANGRVVFERRHSFVPPATNHYWVTKSRPKCGRVNGLDSVLENVT
jgi:hypothetical protein